MNDIYSFYQLISKFQIEIPIIQRDYAQGRNNPKAEDVRKSMVRSLIKSVTEDKSPLFFDFVYGRIDGNKFIPFDGQQRLTTLFLFHKYIFEKCQSSPTCDYKTNCICQKILLQFSYATRQSSREFCEQMVSNSVIPSEDYYNRIRDKYIKKLLDKQEDDLEKKTDEYVANKADWMSSYIKNQSWFYSDWEKDPTIVGMLTMLDEIHNLFTKKEINDYKLLAEKLTSGCSCPITFHFVDMGEHKLSDDTYVKMNARGKSLTPFENFKASLEQYLENGKMNGDNEDRKEICANLLERFRGIYDIERKCYTGVDGIWLDLFYNVMNPGEKEKKELPDAMMLSFINRHFMNVWRCWYGLNKESDKQKEYDNFNQRIITEMPLYPTKDNFVSWEIYQYVLDNCEFDKCLTPIFNIWDKLCYEQDNIFENSQAVWNRGKNEKWNLFEGSKNNDNRETYPSRVAFYALLMYFVGKKEEIETTLAQWMRVVWNIIENSTIDSSDTYQSALSLIDKLSKNCDDIYDALANHFDDFQLDSSYHAQEQVQEEVKKATKITEDPSWKEKILEAETCSYLKGKIWVLFQDGINTSLKLFIQRHQLLNSIINNADDYYLPKILISYYDKKRPEKTIELKKSEKNWKTLLTDKKIGLFSCFQKIQSNSINSNIKYQWIKDIAETQLLNYSRNDAKKVGTYGNSIVLWGTSGCKRYVFANEVWGNVLIGNHRTLLVEGQFELQNNNIVVQNTKFVSYFDVNFKYDNHLFQWYGSPNETELDIYLMEDNWNGYKKRLKYKEGQPDKENYYCFKVDTNPSLNSFIEDLNCLIHQAETDRENEDYYLNCQNKVCE